MMNTEEEHACCPETRIQRLSDSLAEILNGLHCFPRILGEEPVEKLLALSEELVAAKTEFQAQNEKLTMARQIAEHERLRYLELFENSPDGYLITSNSGTIREINRAAAALLQAEQTYFIGKRITRYIAPEHQRELLCRMEGLSCADGLHKWECRMRGCKGKDFHSDVRIAVLRSNEPEERIVRWLIRDITSRKQAEEQLRHMSNQLLRVQEEERKRLSMELHDSIGQYLSAAKFSVESVLVRMSDKLGDAERRSLEAVVPILQSSIGEVRRLYTDLRPPLLDDMGILMTIQWFLRQFRDIYPSIRFVKNIQIEENDISDLLKVVIFRIMQEAFHNIVRHSGADTVVLSLTRESGQIVLLIRDNGEGIRQNRKTPDDFYKKGLGLVSMRERTELSGGSFSIRSSSVSGTEIRASWTF